jgi:hypothetical protein
MHLTPNQKIVLDHIKAQGGKHVCIGLTCKAACFGGWDMDEIERPALGLVQRGLLTVRNGCFYTLTEKGEHPDLTLIEAAVLGQVSGAPQHLCDARLPGFQKAALRRLEAKGLIVGQDESTTVPPAHRPGVRTATRGRTVAYRTYTMAPKP